MTELQQALAFLRARQGRLHSLRTDEIPMETKFAERAVKAALSWVWDVQERARQSRRSHASRCGHDHD
jgi:hypothetical protein